MKSTIAIKLCKPMLVLAGLSWATVYHPFHGSIAAWPSYELMLVAWVYAAWRLPELLIVGIWDARPAKGAKS